MGNKLYTLQVKFQGERRHISLSPDSSVEQLKRSISDKFNIAPEDQELYVNGRLLLAEDQKTLKQAKLLNGSKILCSKVKRGENKSVNSKIYTEEDNVKEQFLVKLKTVEEATKQLEVDLDKVVDNVNFAKELTRNDNTKDLLKKLKMEGAGIGERLMQQLEELDQLHLSHQDSDLRVRKKKAVNSLNMALDRIDKIKEETQEIIKTIL